MSPLEITILEDLEPIVDYLEDMLEKKSIIHYGCYKKVSYLPAKRMESSAPPQMRYKGGRIEVGADADITIFDPNTIIDRSTVKEPTTPSTGVEYVIINGVIVKDKNGIVEGVNPGKPIRSYFVDKIPEEEPIPFNIQVDGGGIKTT